MRILYHHRTRCTDAQRVHILEMIGAFRRLGHEVEIASVVDTEAEAGDEAAEPRWKRVVRRIPLLYEFVQLGYNFAAIPWLLAKIRRRRPDLIYERYSLLNFSGVLAARLSRVPIALEVNSPFAIEQHLESEIRAVRLALWMERVICNAATLVIVVSGPLRRIMAGQGVRASKLIVMPNAANLDHLRSGRGEAARESLGVSGKTVIGFAGWFRKWHGLELLIEAFAASDLPSSGAALLLIGDGPAMPDLRDRAASLPSGSVIFTGGIAHERVQDYLEAIDIAVQPAANPYCCPMKIIEYMGLGKAIVAPRQENIEELLEDGREALLFAPGDREDFARVLEALACDPERRARLGANALERIHRRGMLWTDNAARVVQSVAARMPGESFPAALANGGSLERL